MTDDNDNDTITGKELQGVLGGGAAAGGAYVWVKLRLGGAEQTILVEKSMVGMVMAAFATAAGMARSERLRLDPAAERGGTRDGAIALDLVGVKVARSGSVPDTAILDLHLDASGDNELNLFLAAKPEALLRLRGAIDRALELVAGAKPRVKAN